jgi:tRNA (guanine-N7-)-methyltransferase
MHDGPPVFTQLDISANSVTTGANPALSADPHETTRLLRDMIAPGSLAGVHVYFPDPWPKARHHKRRLIQPALVDLLASRLALGGWLHCATDWDDYAEPVAEPFAAYHG